MIRRRLSVALVAATGTTLALVTPVHAETAPDQEQAVSSLSSLPSGSSAAGTAETGEEEDSQLPGWAQSAELDDNSLLAIEIIKAVLAVGLALTQAAVIVLPFIPGGTDQLRGFLTSLGLQP